MNKRIIIFLILAFVAVTVAQARQNEHVWVAYDVDFEMKFDNREYYKSAFSNSMTIFGARLTPTVGLTFQSSDGARHSVMAGIDMMKDFGSQKGSLEDHLQEPTLYYRLERNCGKMDLELYAGIFSRNKSEGKYSEAFFSDSLRFYYNNLEGILVKFKYPKSYYEVGCDWTGQYGQTRRERFIVYSSGESKVADILTLGYSGYMYHFAGSQQVRGVVDNILLNPYACLDFSHLTGFQTLSLRLGWLQGLQHDRRMVGHYVRPGGGEVDVEVRKWNVGVKNSMFYGSDMMPYYNNADFAGIKYGTSLYFGDPFYRVHDDSATGPGLYDRLEVYWNPYVSSCLDIKVRALFHFHGSHYSGCQQMVSLNFNLDKLLERK